eukprot:TRINITY_DN2_c0_g1_i2.p1 TRINITY_DN2_c0_g1~~TRINITY_DN2_c0_g1_i2.p1  ORF type:complete len:979 (-),score=117.83 TRINITY_DN2_c0_g1_i2:56-2992(-)
MILPVCIVCMLIRNAFASSEKTDCISDFDSAECRDQALFVQMKRNATSNELGKDSCEEIIRHVDGCLGINAEDNVITSRMQKLITVRTYEIASKLIDANCSLAQLGEGWDNDPNVLDAAKLAAEDAAVSLVREEFDSRVLATLTGKNITLDAIEQFTKAVTNLIEMCPDGEEKETFQVSDLSEILHESPSMNISRLAMDTAMYIEGRCQEEVLDLEYFVGKFVAATGSSCNDLVTTSFLHRQREETRKLEYYAKSALALHDETNQLGHHLAANLRGESAGDSHFHDAMLQAAKNVSRRSAIVRLHYVEAKHFEEMHGFSRSSYCSRHRELVDARPDHWIAQSRAIKSYVKCMCSEQRPALVCDAENRYDLQMVGNKLKHELLALQGGVPSLLQSSHGLWTNSSANGTEMGTSNATGAVGLGPCQDSEGNTEAFSCELCVAGDCIDPSSGEGTQDIFGALKPLFQQTVPCLSGSCAACMGIKPGDPIQFKLELGASVDKCSSPLDVFASFQIYIAVKMCIGGVLGEIADKVGWSACMELAKLAWHPFISKLKATINLPVPLPPPIGVRATLEANLRLGELSDVVINHCASKSRPSLKHRCFQEMYIAQEPTGITFKVDVLLGVNIPFVGSIGQWKNVFETKIQEDDNSRTLAMNRAGVTILNIGSSSSNRKCGKALSGVKCRRDAGDKQYRANQWDQHDDRFNVESSGGRQVCVKREDNNGGWGMQLEIACVPSQEEPKPAVAIGSSFSNSRCAFPPERVTCQKNAANPNVRLGFDQHGDKFEVTRHQSGRICARRTDNGGGWGLNLIIECDGTDNSGDVWAPTTLHFGRSAFNEHCILRSHTLQCDSEAGNQGFRMNDDRHGDTFHVHVFNDWVCARRLNHDGGWGMDLKVQCKKKTNEGSVVKVRIGSTNANLKCVETGYTGLKCSLGAGRPEMRYNYHEAGDTFSVWSHGSHVCAKRSDSNGGWGMDLEVACLRLT